MQDTQCPNCGHRYPLPYQPVEAQILKAVEVLQRNSGKASTRGIAGRVHLSDSQTFRYLARLELRGEVLRVGTKGGWRTAA